MLTSVLPDHNDLLPAFVSTKALVELVPGSDHNNPIPKIEIPDEKTESAVSSDLRNAAESSGAECQPDYSG